MVSLITDKLRRQMLDDNAVGTDALQREQPREMVVGSTRKATDIQSLSDSQNDFRASHESRIPDDFPDHECCCESSINLLASENPEVVIARQRDESSSASCTSHDGCRLCSPSNVLRLPTTKKRQSHVMLSPDENDASATWRPDWQATSIWRPVGLRNPTPGFPAQTRIAAAMPTSEAFCSSEFGDWTSRRLSTTSSESPSPVLRPASASSGFFENSGGACHVTGQWVVGSKQSPSLNNQSAFSLTSRLSLNDDTMVGSSSVVRSVPGSGSMPAIGGDDGCSGSLGLSGQPQRCHSQPSVLLERRGVKKRRREERRPNLNFIKMKETAYSKRHQGAHSRARNHVQFIENNSNFLQVAKSDGGGDQSRFFYSLDTIASSPQQLAFCQASISPTSGAATPLQSAGDSDVGESGAYRESLDSGCNGDFVSCFDAKSPLDLESRKKKKQLNVGIEEEEEEVFDLDLLDDLDIEEIEKD